jgi:hypothetical protein
MSNKFKDKLIQLIGKEGVPNVARTLGMTRTEVIHNSGIKFGPEIASMVLFELAREGKIPLDYKEYEIIPTHDGLFAWESQKNVTLFGHSVRQTIIVYATPFWDGISGVPIEFSFYALKNRLGSFIFDQDYAGEYFTEIQTMRTFEGITELLLWYKNVYLPEVYRVITEVQFPKFMEDNSESLKIRLDDYFDTNK